MKFLNVSFFCFIFVVFSPPIATPQPTTIEKMKRVKLMSDTFDDIAKIFGPPLNPEKNLSMYFLETDGRVNTIFSSGECLVSGVGDGEVIGWKVPKWTVVDISFRPKKRILPKSLGIDLANFKKTPIADVPGAFIFRNEKLGIEYSVTPEGTVEQIGFFPTRKFSGLHC